jgi:predicted nucleic acid-binding protein
MATTVADQVFVDTNVLVYANLALSPFNTAATTGLHTLRKAAAELWISRQILREYLAAMTRPGLLTGSIPISSLTADVQSFGSMFRIAEDGPTVSAHLLRLLQSIAAAGKQIHDANIVATMLAHGIPKLLTHNTADFARFGGLITVVPLVP